MDLDSYFGNLRDEVLHALDDEVLAGEDDDGMPLWEAAPHARAVAAAMAAVDEMHYQAVLLARSGRAMERVMRGHGIDVTDGTLPVTEYMAAVEREAEEHPGTYVPYRSTDTE